MIGIQRGCPPSQATAPLGAFSCSPLQKVLPDKLVYTLHLPAAPYRRAALHTWPGGGTRDQRLKWVGSSIYVAEGKPSSQVGRAFEVQLVAVGVVVSPHPVGAPHL